MSDKSILELLFHSLPSLSGQHAHDSKMYEFLKHVARMEVERLFHESAPKPRKFMPFGELIFPYYKMGVVDSLNLFDLDELIIFSFYWINRKRYRRVLDLGANIGLHSILLSKCGFNVRAYEPDPQHFQILQRNLSLNNCFNVEAVNAAISSKAGKAEFVRVLGNTTGSHLAGSKANPYGDLERFYVDVEAIGPLMAWGDLIKLDVEGHEAEVLLNIDNDSWSNTDAFVEIENENNAAIVYERFKSMGVRLFSQKNAWRLVRDIDDMPTSYREGTLFVTAKRKMPWGTESIKNLGSSV